MANMSYCQFQNTLQDLRDCWEDWEDPQSERSEEEKRAQDKMLKLCREIAEEVM